MHDLIGIPKQRVSPFFHRSESCLQGIKRSDASKEMISASVELCETEVCFLHIQFIGTNV